MLLVMYHMLDNMQLKCQAFIYLLKVYLFISKSFSFGKRSLPLKHFAAFSVSSNSIQDSVIVVMESHRISYITLVKKLFFLSCCEKLIII